MDTPKAPSSGRKDRSQLKEYYTSPPLKEERFLDPFDMNGPDFNPDLFLNRIVKEKDLTSLMKEEVCLYKSISSLDSEMQTLVYENYNKFISATDTITKMSSNFNEIEDELNLLSKKINQMCSSSRNLSETFSDKRSYLAKLSSTSVLLNKLHFLFELPVKMSTFYAEKNYIDSIKAYLQAESTLREYQHFPSIKKIDEECQALLVKLKEKLHESFSAPVSAIDSSDLASVTSIIALLLQLNENPEFLSFRFIKYSSKKLDQKLSELDYYIKMNEKHLKKGAQIDPDEIPVDVLEFVDMACNGLLSQLVTTVHSFDHLFLTSRVEESEKKTSETVSMKESLVQFVDKYMSEFMNCITTRCEQELASQADMKFMARSLDRFHRRVVAVRKVLPDHNYSKQSSQVINSVVGNLICGLNIALKESFNEEVVRIRQIIVASPNEDPARNIISLITSLEEHLYSSICNVVESLKNYVAPEIQFSKEEDFASEFMQKVQREVVFDFLNFVVDTLESYSSGTENMSSILILMFSRLCFNLEQSLITKILNKFESLSKLPTGHVTGQKANIELRSKSKKSGQELLVSFVILEGHNVSQMIRKSVENRDWLATVEPRAVRTVIKRVIEDLQTIDTNVGQLFEEGTRNDDNSSEASSRSRRTGTNTFYSQNMFLTSQGNNGNGSNPYGMANQSGHSLDINIQKFLSEKIDLKLSAIETNKTSVMTSIIKVMLKSLVEVVRMTTFSKFGLQQIQVDCFYLQMFSWKFVSDESIVYNMLEDTIQSAVNRCLDEPLLMDMTMVENICEN